MNKNFLAKKIIALFMLLTVSTQAVETHLYASIAPASTSPAYKNNQGFSLSQEIGKVEEVFEGSSGKKIIYIQDAHDSLEAQENIARMIDVLVAKHGVKTVFEEGYEGIVPTDEYFGGIQDKDVKAKVSHYFLDKLRIGGAEYAHINRKEDFQLVGADNIKMHFENVSWYREAALYEKVTKEDLKELHHEIEQLVQERFPKDFKTWLKLKARSEAHEISLVDYLNRTMSGKGMQREKYPVLSLLLQAGKSESPVLLEQARHIDGKTLFEEIDRFENDYAASFLTHETDRKIFQYYKAISLLKRLSDIEMTSSEYATVKAYLESFSTQNLAEFLARETKKSMILPRQWESSIRHAVRFYELAKLRDEAVRGKIEKWAQTSGENTAALVFGGFHKEQIRQYLKELNISYTIVSPQMQSPDAFHKAVYRDLMLRDYSRFEMPALIKQAATPPRGFELALAGGPAVRAELQEQIQQVERAVLSVGDLQAEENLRDAIDEVLTKQKKSARSETRVDGFNSKEKVEELLTEHELLLVDQNPDSNWGHSIKSYPNGLWGFSVYSNRKQDSSLMIALQTFLRHGGFNKIYRVEYLPAVQNQSEYYRLSIEPLSASAPRSTPTAYPQFQKKRSEVRSSADENENGGSKERDAAKHPGFFLENIFKFLIWFSELSFLQGYFRLRPFEFKLYEKMELISGSSGQNAARHERDRESVFLKHYKRYFFDYVRQRYLKENQKEKLENGEKRLVVFEAGNLIAKVAESAHLWGILVPLLLMPAARTRSYLIVNGINLVVQIWFIVIHSRSTRAEFYQHYQAFAEKKGDHGQNRSEVRSDTDNAEASKKKYIRFPKVNETDIFRYEVFPGQTISTTDKKLSGLLPFIQRNEEIPAGQEFISTRTGGSHGEIHLATLHQGKEKAALSYIGASHAEGQPIKPFIWKTGEREYSVGLSVKSVLTGQYYPVTSYVFAKDGKILDGTPLPSNLQVSGKIPAAGIPFTTFPVVKEIIYGLTKGELPPKLSRLTQENLTQAGLKGLFVKGRIDFWKDSVRLNTLRDFQNTFLTLDRAPWLLSKNAQAAAPWVATLWIPAEGKRPEIPIDSMVLFSETKFKSTEGINVPAGITRKRPFIAGRRGFEKVTGEIPEGKRAAGDVFKALWNIYWLAGGTDQVPDDDLIQISHGNDPYLYRFNEKTVTIKLGPEFSKDQTTRSWVSFPGISEDARGIAYHNLQDGKIIRSQYFLLFKNGRFQMPEPLVEAPSLFKTKVDLLSDELERNIAWMQSSAKQGGRLFFEQADKILGIVGKKENKEIFPAGLTETVAEAVSGGIETFSTAKKHIDVSEESKINALKVRITEILEDSAAAAKVEQADPRSEVRGMKESARFAEEIRNVINKKKLVASGVTYQLFAEKIGGVHGFVLVPRDSTDTGPLRALDVPRNFIPLDAPGQEGVISPVDNKLDRTLFLEWGMVLNPGIQRNEILTNYIRKILVPTVAEQTPAGHTVVLMARISHLPTLIQMAQSLPAAWQEKIADILAKWGSHGDGFLEPGKPYVDEPEFGIRLGSLSEYPQHLQKAIIMQRRIEKQLMNFFEAEEFSASKIQKEKVVAAGREAPLFRPFLGLAKDEETSIQTEWVGTGKFLVWKWTRPRTRSEARAVVPVKTFQDEVDGDQLIKSMGSPYVIAGSSKLQIRFQLEKEMALPDFLNLTKRKWAESRDPKLVNARIAQLRLLDGPELRKVDGHYDLKQKLRAKKMYQLDLDPDLHNFTVTSHGMEKNAVLAELIHIFQTGLTGAPGARTLVELGPGRGFMTKKILDHGLFALIHAIEKNKEAVERLRLLDPSILVHEKDFFEGLPALFQGKGVQKADAVLASHSLYAHMVEDRIQVMTDAVQMLKPEGKAMFVIVRNDPSHDDGGSRAAIRELLIRKPTWDGSEDHWEMAHYLRALGFETEVKKLAVPYESSNPVDVFLTALSWLPESTHNDTKMLHKLWEIVQKESPVGFKVPGQYRYRVVNNQQIIVATREKAPEAARVTGTRAFQTVSHGQVVLRLEGRDAKFAVISVLDHTKTSPTTAVRVDIPDDYSLTDSVDEKFRGRIVYSKNKILHFKIKSKHTDSVVEVHVLRTKDEKFHILYNSNEPVWSSPARPLIDNSRLQMLDGDVVEGSGIPADFGFSKYTLREISSPRFPDVAWRIAGGSKDGVFRPVQRAEVRSTPVTSFEELLKIPGLEAVYGNGTLNSFVERNLSTAAARPRLTKEEVSKIAGIREVMQAAWQTVEPKTSDGGIYGPFVRASQQRLARILQFLNVKPDEAIFDAGFGDGAAILTMASLFGLKAEGAEHNPFLFRKGIAAQRALERKDLLNVDNTRLYNESLLNIAWNRFQYVYYYSFGSTVPAEKIEEKLARELPVGGKFLLLGLNERGEKDTHYENFSGLLKSGIFSLERIPELGIWVFTKTREPGSLAAPAPKSEVRSLTEEEMKAGVLKVSQDFSEEVKEIAQTLRKSGREAVIQAIQEKIQTEIQAGNIDSPVSSNLLAQLKSIDSLNNKNREKLAKIILFLREYFNLTVDGLTPDKKAESDEVGKVPSDGALKSSAPIVPQTNIPIPSIQNIDDQIPDSEFSSLSLREVDKTLDAAYALRAMKTKNLLSQDPAALLKIWPEVIAVLTGMADVAPVKRKFSMEDYDALKQLLYVMNQMLATSIDVILLDADNYEEAIIIDRDRVAKRLPDELKKYPKHYGKVEQKISEFSLGLDYLILHDRLKGQGFFFDALNQPLNIPESKRLQASDVIEKIMQGVNLPRRIPNQITELAFPSARDAALLEKSIRSHLDAMRMFGRDFPNIWIFDDQQGAEAEEKQKMLQRLVDEYGTTFHYVGAEEKDALLQLIAEQDLNLNLAQINAALFPRGQYGSNRNWVQVFLHGKVYSTVDDDSYSHVTRLKELAKGGDLWSRERKIAILKVQLIKLSTDWAIKQHANLTPGFMEKFEKVLKAGSGDQTNREYLSVARIYQMYRMLETDKDFRPLKLHLKKTFDELSESMLKVLEEMSLSDAPTVHGNEQLYKEDILYPLRREDDTVVIPVDAYGIHGRAIGQSTDEVLAPVLKSHRDGPNVLRGDQQGRIALVDNYVNLTGAGSVGNDLNHFLATKDIRTLSGFNPDRVIKTSSRNFASNLFFLGTTTMTTVDNRAPQKGENLGGVVVPGMMDSRSLGSAIKRGNQQRFAFVSKAVLDHERLSSQTRYPEAGQFDGEKYISRLIQESLDGITPEIYYGNMTFSQGVSELVHDLLGYYRDLEGMNGQSLLGVESSTLREQIRKQKEISGKLLRAINRQLKVPFPSLEEIDSLLRVAVQRKSKIPLMRGAQISRKGVQVHSLGVVDHYLSNPDARNHIEEMFNRRLQKMDETIRLAAGVFKSVQVLTSANQLPYTVLAPITVAEEAPATTGYWILDLLGGLLNPSKPAITSEKPGVKKSRSEVRIVSRDSVFSSESIMVGSTNLQTVPLTHGFVVKHADEIKDFIHQFEGNIVVDPQRDLIQKGRLKYDPELSIALMTDKDQLAGFLMAFPLTPEDLKAKMPSIAFPEEKSVYLSKWRVAPSFHKSSVPFYLLLKVLLSARRKGYRYGFWRISKVESSPLALYEKWREKGLIEVLGTFKPDKDADVPGIEHVGYKVDLEKFIAYLEPIVQRSLRSPRSEVRSSDDSPWVREFVPQGIHENPDWGSVIGYQVYRNAFGRGNVKPGEMFSLLEQNLSILRPVLAEDLRAGIKGGTGLSIGFGETPQELVELKERYGLRHVHGVEWVGSRIESAAKYLYDQPGKNYTSSQFTLHHANAHGFKEAIPDNEIDFAISFLAPQTGSSNPVIDEILRVLKPGGWAMLSGLDIKGAALQLLNSHGEIYFNQSNAVIFQKGTPRSEARALTYKGAGGAEFEEIERVADFGVSSYVAKVKNTADGALGALKFHMVLDEDRRTKAFYAAAKQQEIMILKYLNEKGFRGAPSLLDYSDDWLVTGWVQGEDLEKWSKGRPVGEIAAKLAEIAGMIEGVHSLGIVHRDIKPENILIANGKPVILDYGISQKDGKLPEGFDNIKLGKYPYAAPEILNFSDVVGPAADIFSLGVTLFELATDSPFWKENQSFSDFYGDSGRMPSAQEIALRLGDGWKDYADIIAAAIAPVPAARPGLPELKAKILAKRSDRAPNERESPLAPEGLRSEVRTGKKAKWVPVNWDPMTMFVLSHYDHPTLPKGRIIQKGKGKTKKIESQVKWVDGPRLERWIYGAESKKLSDDEFLEKIIRWMIEIGEAASFLHGLGMEHGDITLSNVVIDQNTGHAVLIDFSDYSSPDLEHMTHLLGTAVFARVHATESDFSNRLVEVSEIVEKINARFDKELLALRNRPFHSAEEFVQIFKAYADQHWPALSGRAPDERESPLDSEDPRSEVRGMGTYVRWGVRLGVIGLLGAAGYGVYRVIRGSEDLDEAQKLIYWAKVMLLALPVTGVAAGLAIFWSQVSHFNWRRDGESKLGADREKIRGLFETADAKKKKREAHEKTKKDAKHDFKSKSKKVTQGAGVSMVKIQSGDVPEVRYRIYLPELEEEIVIVAANAKAFVQKFNPYSYYDQKIFKLTAAEGNEMWVPFVVSGAPVKVNIFNEKTPAILKRALDEAESRRSEVRETGDTVESVNDDSLEADIRILMSDAAVDLHEAALDRIRSYPDQKKVYVLIRRASRLAVLKDQVGNWTKIGGWIETNDQVRYQRYLASARKEILMRLFAWTIDELGQRTREFDPEAEKMAKTLRAAMKAAHAAGVLKSDSGPLKTLEKSLELLTSNKSAIGRELGFNQTRTSQNLIGLTASKSGKFYPGGYEIFIDYLDQHDSPLLKAMFDMVEPYGVLPGWTVQEIVKQGIPEEKKYLTGIVRKLQKDQTGIALVYPETSKPFLIKKIQTPELTYRDIARELGYNTPTEIDTAVSKFLTGEQKDSDIKTLLLANRVSRLLLAEPEIRGMEPVRVKLKGELLKEPMRIGQYIYSKKDGVIEAQRVDQKQKTEIPTFRVHQQVAASSYSVEQIVDYVLSYYSQYGILPRKDALLEETGVSYRAFRKNFLFILAELNNRGIPILGKSWAAIRYRSVNLLPGTSFYKVIKENQDEIKNQNLKLKGLRAFKKHMESNLKISIRRLEFRETPRGLQLYGGYVDVWNKPGYFMEYLNVQDSGQSINLLDYFKASGRGLPDIQLRTPFEFVDEVEEELVALPAVPEEIFIRENLVFRAAGSGYSLQRFFKAAGVRPDQTTVTLYPGKENPRIEIVVPGIPTQVINLNRNLKPKALKRSTKYYSVVNILQAQKALAAKGKSFFVTNLNLPPLISPVKSRSLTDRRYLVRLLNRRKKEGLSIFPDKLNRPMAQGGDISLYKSVLEYNAANPDNKIILPNASVSLRRYKSKEEALQALADRAEKKLGVSIEELKRAKSDGGDSSLYRFIVRHNKQFPNDPIILTDKVKPQPDAAVLYKLQTNDMAVLPEEKRVELWHLAKQGDSKARNQLIESFIPFVRETAEASMFDSTNNNKGFEEDLLQAGNVLMIQAVDQWNPELGIPLSSFVQQEVERNMVFDALQTRKPLSKYSLTNPMGSSDMTLEQTVESRESGNREHLDDLDGFPDVAQAIEARDKKMGRPTLSRDEKKALAAELGEWFLKKGLLKESADLKIKSLAIYIIGSVGTIGSALRGYSDLNLMIVTDAEEDGSEELMERMREIIGGDFQSSFEDGLPRVILGKEGNYQQALREGNGFISIVHGKYGIGSEAKGIASVEIVRLGKQTLQEEEESGRSGRFTPELRAGFNITYEDDLWKEQGTNGILVLENRLGAAQHLVRLSRERIDEEDDYIHSVTSYFTERFLPKQSQKFTDAPGNKVEVEKKEPVKARSEVRRGGLDEVIQKAGPTKFFVDASAKLSRPFDTAAELVRLKRAGAEVVLYNIRAGEAESELLKILNTFPQTMFKRRFSSLPEALQPEKFRKNVNLVHYSEGEISDKSEVETLMPGISPSIIYIAGKPGSGAYALNQIAAIKLMGDQLKQQLQDIGIEKRSGYLWVSEEKAGSMMTALSLQTYIAFAQAA